MQRKSELLHKFIRGFKFKDDKLSYANFMDRYIGEFGEIVDVDSYSVQVRFKGNDCWWYPLNGIQEHIVQLTEQEPEHTDASTQSVTNYEIY
jgi:hypothetical protein